MKKYIFLFLTAWLAASCSNFLEEYSQDLAKVESYADLDELLLGDGYWKPAKAYNLNDGAYMEDPYLMGLHLMSDETEILRQYDADEFGTIDDFYGWITWQQQVGRDYRGSAISKEDRDWNELYERINVVNQVIGHINEQPAANELDELEKTRIKGEAHFLRAAYYFTLVNMYARPYDPATATDEFGIPLKLYPEVDDREYETASLRETYGAILADLATARECLGQSEVKNHPYRADIVAAHLLSSRVYLYMQDWQNAYNHADSVIRRKGELVNLTSWEEDEAGNFLNRSSVETIFSMGGHLLAPALFITNGIDRWGDEEIYPIFTVSPDLVNLYGADNDDSDCRRGIFIKKITTMFGYYGKGGDVWVFNKVDGPQLYTSGMACDVSDFYLMRTAEAYLNAAEAAAKMDKTDIAIERLQQLRSHRVNGGTANYGSGDELIKFIYDERERELCLEGHRWFDLRRYMVDTKCKYTKKIVHYFTDFNSPSVNPNTGENFQTFRYVLEENSPNYTLALPKEVTDFQNTLPSVRREPILGSVYNEYPDLAEAGYDDGYRAGLKAGAYDQENGLEYDDSDYNSGYNEYYNYEYGVFYNYSGAYYDGFLAGYEEGYGKIKESAYDEGYKAGKEAAADDLYYGDGYWSSYTESSYKYGAEDFDSEEDQKAYKDGFKQGYEDRWNEE